MPNHLVIIDGHHLMYRAYWAIPRTLKTKSGEQTNAVFGVVSMTLNILKQEEPDALIFCFDEGEETFRHTEAKDYKAGRAETPDDFYIQIPRILEFLDRAQLKHVSSPKYEADDFLCAYARAAEARGDRVTIVTGDRDALQLATPLVRIAIPHKGYQEAEYLTPEAILAKYGVRPDQIASYKGLTGDASDNLPGVNGIGPKTAATLLQKYETLENLYAHVDEVPGASREKLERDREQAFFCERMATLVCDFPLPIPLDDIRLSGLPGEAVLEFCRDMEFTVLLKRLQGFLATPYGSKVFTAPRTLQVDRTKSPEDQLKLF